MQRSILNLIFDALALVGLILLIATGLIIRFVLPPLKGNPESPYTLWEMNRHQWGDIHFWMAIGLFIVLVIHLYLHRKWIVSMVQGKSEQGFGLRSMIAISILLLLLILVIIPFLSPTEKKAAPKNKHLQQKFKKEPAKGSNPSEETTSNLNIRGYMTLNDLAQATGVPANYFIKELGLPENISLDSKLGHLRKQYDFKFSKIRTLAQNFQK